MEWKQKSLLNELTQGKVLAEQLRNHLGGDLSSAMTSIETLECLVKKLLSSYEKALSMLNWDEYNNNLNDFAVYTNTTSKEEERFAGRLCQKQSRKGVSKRRKTLSGPSWTEQVRSWSVSTREGVNNDGYSWKKYGQKEIVGAAFPRGYYRCAHYSTQGCLAAKHVQRSDEDPTILNVKYCGQHACVQVSQSQVTTPSTMDQQHQENTKTTSERILDQRFNFTEDEFLSQALLLSPSIALDYAEENMFRDSNFEYFPMSSSHINSWQSSESDVVDIVSASIPVSSSSVEDIYDLPHHNINFGENYPFFSPF